MKSHSETVRPAFAPGATGEERKARQDRSRCSHSSESWLDRLHSEALSKLLMHNNNFNLMDREPASKARDTWSKR